MSLLKGMNAVTQLLDLDEFEVVDVSEDRSRMFRRIDVIPRVSAGVCPKCQKATNQRHQTRERVVRDLPLGRYATELVVRLPQYQCPDCGEHFTPRFQALAESAHATERFLERLAEMVRWGEIKNAAGFFGLPEKTLERWYYDYLERRGVDKALKPVRSLGIDEISRKKKRGRFCCVLIDHTNNRVLEVLESRDKQTLMNWLKQARDNGLLGALEEVTTDMWDGYVEAAKEVFGAQIRITIDRFHVMKNFQESLERSRRQIQRELPQEAAKALKGSRWLWLTNPENLDKAELEELERLKTQFPGLATLSAQRESLRQIFEDRTIRTAQDGVARLQAWCCGALETGLKGLETFCGTLTNWMDKIANYFVSRSSNGQTEGFNRGIRSILWRAFGIPNFNHLRIRILHSLG